MRSRSGSGVRLDRILFMVEQTIMKHQDPITGLFANNPIDFPGHAWVRDNVYAVQALWALYRAYQKTADFDEDLVKANELGMTCVKMMQSMLECMMLQAEKVEMFKQLQRPLDALHAKYCVRTKSVVVGDSEWGHLQIDATSLFLLTLAQITASGLQIVRNFDEVAFIQNLVYYIENGYRTPDFGIWERGDKTNQGIRELNASSIGMVKAALQALNDVGDLFGDGSKGSVIHVNPDEIEQCSAVLASMLPRESFSKETDAALLTIISYPAFSVEDPELVELTRSTITSTLLGAYGCRRFLRDGYKTALEDPTRLYYNKSELQQFEGVECEWPLFLCLLVLDAMYRKADTEVEHYWSQLESVLKVCDRGFRYVPELYTVERDHVGGEKRQRGSQPRTPAGAVPYLWAQSLYVIASLLYEGFLSPAELDPLSRRLSAYEKRPPCEVQVVVLAESVEVQRELRSQGVFVQRIDELDPVFSIRPPSVLAAIQSRVGECKKLGLSGRPRDRDVGLLSTSRLYQIGDKFVVFTPQFMDARRAHLLFDIRVMMDEWSSELQYLYASWNSVSISGRPLVALVIRQHMLTATGMSSSLSLNRQMQATVLGTIKKISTGYLGGARVVMKNLGDFFRTTAVSKLEVDLDGLERGEEEERIHFTLPPVEHTMSPTGHDKTPERDSKVALRRAESVKNRRAYSVIHKASMRHRSIVMDSNDTDLVQLRLAYTRSRSGDEEAGSESAVSSPMRIPGRIDRSSPLPPLSESPLTRNNVLHTEQMSADASTRLDLSQMGEMRADALVDMLVETTVLEEQASIVHWLWMKFGPDFETSLNDEYVTVRCLMEEVHSKACECREWALVRLTAGLLQRHVDGLSNAVTHLLVRQKQITLGLPSQNEEAITCPKTNEELKQMMLRAYGDDPNAFILSQELIISLGSLVRTEPRLFTEVFRLRIGLITQVLASELARLRSLSATDALTKLLHVSPFELKSMLLLLLSGRLLEEASDDDGVGRDVRTGIGSFRKHIEERKSRRSLHVSRTEGAALVGGEGVEEEEEDDDEDDFQFGVWLRHRRIDGALNRVPADFYAVLWDTVHRFPHGMKIDQAVLHWGLTQEMTRREIKFALEVEEVLNQIAEPEYREVIVETLWLLGRLEQLVRCDRPRLPDGPVSIDSILQMANGIFVAHNRDMETVVVECCGGGHPCGGARRLCQHFYDSAPAGEYGTSHYIIRALVHMFT